MLDPQVDETPLLEDVRATRGGGPDGSGLVVVEGVWGAAAGGPPPVLLVDAASRRHTIVALDSAPPDDPMAFRATFAVPADLVDRLGDGLALCVGHTEMPLTLSEPAAAADAWLEGAPVVARRASPERDDERVAAEAPPEPERTESAAEPAEPKAAAADPDEPVAARAGRPSDRGAGEAVPADEGRSIAAAILRVTAPPAPPGATVVERSVIAERRARRSEQLAAVMERRARGAEVTAQELTDRIAALEARIAEISAERDRLAAELELQRVATAHAQAAREAAEARLAELIDHEGAAPPAEGDQLAAARVLPGLEEAARAMRGQPPARPAASAAGEANADPFADALAKLRGDREDLVAAVAPAVARPPEEPVASVAAPEAREEPVAAVAARPAPVREHVVPYLISADHPRGPWLADAIAALDDIDRPSAALLVMQLLPDQARTVRRPLAYDLDLAGAGPLRIELEPRGSGRVLTRHAASSDAALSLEATPAEFATLAAGGAPLWPRGLRAGGGRRSFLPLTSLSRARRRRLTLADLVDAALPLDPGLVIRALTCAVPADWTQGHSFAVTVTMPGRETCRVMVGDGAPVRVLRVDESGRRAVVAATTAPVAAPAGAVGAADAVLTVSDRGMLPLLAQAEPPADEEPATVLGDLAAVTTLLSWFDRAQGLGPRA